MNQELSLREFLELEEDIKIAYIETNKLSDKFISEIFYHYNWELPYKLSKVFYEKQSISLEYLKEFEGNFNRYEFEYLIRKLVTQYSSYITFNKIELSTLEDMLDNPLLVNSESYISLSMAIYESKLVTLEFIKKRCDGFGDKMWMMIISLKSNLFDYNFIETYCSSGSNKKHLDEWTEYGLGDSSYTLEDIKENFKEIYDNPYKFLRGDNKLYIFIARKVIKEVLDK